jgi:ketosteroid isomerase-like protein
MTGTAHDKDRRLAVRQAQQQFWNALQNKDKQAFEHLIADDFIQSSPGQPNQDRTPFIDTLTSFPGRVRSIGSDDLEEHIWGEIAVVTGVQLAQIELANGQMMSNRIAITNIFQDQQGRWVLKLAHAVSLE